jgi:hypothetical protein
MEMALLAEDVGDGRRVAEAASNEDDRALLPRRRLPRRRCVSGEGCMGYAGSMKIRVTCYSQLYSYIYDIYFARFSPGGSHVAG